MKDHPISISFLDLCQSLHRCLSWQTGVAFSWNPHGHFRCFRDRQIFNPMSSSGHAITSQTIPETMGHLPPVARARAGRCCQGRRPGHHQPIRGRCWARVTNQRRGRPGPGHWSPLAGAGEAGAGDRDRWWRTQTSGVSDAPQPPVPPLRLATHLPASNPVHRGKTSSISRGNIKLNAVQIFRVSQLLHIYTST